MVFVEFLLSLLLGAVLTGFACLHLWMISHNLTTIEFCENRDIGDSVNLYSLYYTGAGDSFKAVMGKSIFLYLLPFC